ncbi:MULTISPECIES: SDR family oxidoreductase [unclassified Streptomyces]|uniref:SDR family oxidoreductase n=1 Tax=unclassified Streptomyces TaxID=2593676 RepID=UPI00081EBD37|nr:MULTISPECIES: SDR family oxidoreductase [unclassified Streptomyces]MYR94797.1 SDR family oxidoreductase [Streptomyces sp. SID4937]SCD78200.1 NAD(P)-dependent dehydrogenase, short-chain alcohol dehydrogenase family [Streptomyces sp. ScaeMP-e83]
MTKYARRKALVVGEATDIGLAIAKRLVEGGASVLLTARTEAERAHAVAELGSAARVLTPSAVEAALTGEPAPAGDGTTGTTGLGNSPTGLAEGPTGSGDGPTSPTGPTRVGLLFADAIPTARPLLPYVEDGGAVVLTAPTPCPDAVRALAGELAARGIRVNAVAPGCIEAPGSGAVPLPPLGRLGAAEEVARAALFLATEATFTTGARLPVDGGLGRP